VTVNAADNWIPAGVSDQTVVIRTNYQSSLSLENKNVNDASLSIYPNPNDGFINVKHAFLVGTNPVLSIQDVSGKNVFSTKLIDNSQEVDVSSLVPGVYFATVFANHQTPKTIKIVKK
jgi:Secretion system C-terminal sorting domain